MILLATHLLKVDSSTVRVSVSEVNEIAPPPEAVDVQEVKLDSLTWRREEVVVRNWMAAPESGVVRDSNVDETDERDGREY
ncbi:hypothetical protein TL16_g00568 [Triparma laevis f. inornata]|uniref:Uncharacterized protein n=1 Tax=Triparma laevis f. inornata TaxID=1714386 RepID=A0A9W7DN10_9STRA|nr:hypothetical protein TL16_g00568 [Triparma laevis f. inornata]